MRKHMKLLAAVAGVSLLALMIAGNLPAKGPKLKTAMYTIEGDVCSGQFLNGVCVVDLDNDTDAVEIGVTARAWIPTDGTLALRVSGDVLCEYNQETESCDPIDGTELSGGEYYGRARLLDHRFDFEFDTEPGCELIGYATPLPLQPDDPHCRYGLQFGEGNWAGDGSVEFSEFMFVDYTQAASKCPSPYLHPSCRGVGIRVPYGVRLFPAVVEEPAQENCKNGTDDDGDRLVDCDDPDCSSKRFCN